MCGRAARTVALPMASLPPACRVRSKVATRGDFLQIALTAAFGSSPLMSAGCASKAGAEPFAQALRTDLRSAGVGVGIAYLHWTDTAMIDARGDQPVLLALRCPTSLLPSAGSTAPTRSPPG